MAGTNDAPQKIDPRQCGCSVGYVKLGGGYHAIPMLDPEPRNPLQPSPYDNDTEIDFGFVDGENPRFPGIEISGFESNGKKEICIDIEIELLEELKRREATALIVYIPGELPSPPKET